MKFSSSHRRSDGRLETLEIEAESRAEAVQKLRAMGVVSLELKEVRGDIVSRRSRGFYWGVIAGAMSVLIGVGVWCCLSQNTRKSQKLEEKKVSVKPMTAVGNTKVKTRKEPSASRSETGNEITPPPVEALQTVQTNVTPAVTNYLAGNRIVTNKPPKVYRSATEQMLHTLFATPIGSLPPPLPRIPGFDRKKMDEILNSSMPVNAGDSEHAREQKQIIDQARQALKEYLAQGGDPDDFMTFYSDKLRAFHEEWKQSQRLAVQSCMKDDPEVARQMVDIINEKLAEKGIKPVNLPPKLREKIGFEPIEKKGN